MPSKTWARAWIAALFLCCLPSLAAAQALTYVGRVERTCDGLLPTGCSRGTILAYEPSTTGVAATFELWDSGGYADAILDLASNPDGSQLYVLSRRGPASAGSTNVLSVIDTGTGHVVEWFTQAGSVGHMAVSADGTRLIWSVGHPANDGFVRLFVVDAETGQQLGEVPTDNVAIAGLAIVPDGSRFFVAFEAFDDSRLAVYDTATLQEASMEMSPSRLYLAPDGRTLFAREGTAYRVIDTATLTTVGTIAPRQLYEIRSLTVARGRIYAFEGGEDYSGGEASIYDADTLAYLGTIPGIGDPKDSGATADESWVLVTPDYGGGLWRIDTGTDQFSHSGVFGGLFGPIVAAPIAPPFSDAAVDAFDAPVSAPFDVTGWAIDAQGLTGPGVDAVHVWAYPSGGGTPRFVGAAEYGEAKRDARALYGTRYSHSGFRLDVQSLPAGTYELRAFAHSSHTGTFPVSAATTVTVAASPQLMIDAPAPGASIALPATVAGWALDLAAASGSGMDAVHVWAYPLAGGPALFVGAAPTGTARPDLGDLFGPQFASAGFALTIHDLPAGAYRLVVFGHDQVTGQFSVARERDITVRRQTYLLIDSPAPGPTSTSFTIAGWAIDDAAPSGSGIDAVQVWAFPTTGEPIFLGGASLGVSRPDVAALLGDDRFSSAGYALTVPNLPAGDYTLVVAARSVVNGRFDLTSVVAVTTSDP